MAQYALVFNFSSLKDLRNQQCKHLLQKLDEAEDSIYEQLHMQVRFRGDSSLNSPSSHYRERNTHLSIDSSSKGNFNFREPRSSKKVPELGLGSILNDTSQKSVMAKTPRMQSDNFRRARHGQISDEDKTVYK